MTNKIEKDRRQYRRYRVSNRLFAIVRSDMHLFDRFESMSKGEIAMAIIKSKPTHMGEIVEISRGGLSFQYIDTDRILSQPCELDILFIDEDFHLSGLPFQAVEDRSIKSDAPFDVLRMKRLTVKFCGLTSKQKLKLDHLLKNYTSGKIH
jgi:hypothetical protein